MAAAEAFPSPSATDAFKRWNWMISSRPLGGELLANAAWASLYLCRWRENDGPLDSNLRGAANFYGAGQERLGFFGLASAGINFAEGCQGYEVVRGGLQRGLQLLGGAIVLAGAGIGLA